MEQLTCSDAASAEALARELRSIPVFEDLPDEGLCWLASQMTVTTGEQGEIFVREDSPADRLFVILEGELRGTRESDGTDTRVFVAKTGQVTGLLPYSRLKTIPLTIRPVVRSRVASLPKEQFPEMLQRMPVLAQKLVGVLSDRIRESTRNEQHQEKMAALGKLSAGLAHELNNPASAAHRAAESLRQAINGLREANQRLDARALSTEQRLFLSQLEGDVVAHEAPLLDALERSDREEEIAAWLEKRSISHAAEMAAGLVEAGLEFPCLEKIAAQFPDDAIEDVLRRVSASLLVGRLATEIEHSTSRISDLVKAIKEYSHMDQMPEQEVDVHDGLETTLLILKHRLKQGVTIQRDYDRALPKVCAHPGELNQVWTNLIDNAVDAMNGKGELRIRTCKEPKQVLVEIGDNGAGIPPDVQQRVFEPFFTTKGVGQGLGLGLDIVYRIIRNHHGDVTFKSRPGDTRFQVRLPIPGANDGKQE